jgi:P27 family predicted phage terminase small subunit
MTKKIKLKKLTRPQLLDFLKDKGLYEEVDDSIISNLFFCLSVMEEAQAHIRKDGNLINVSGTGVAVWKRNPSLNIYFDALKNFEQLGRKLGLSPSDRRNLRLDAEVVDDGFDD